MLARRETLDRRLGWFVGLTMTSTGGIWSSDVNPVFSPGMPLLDVLLRAGA